MVKDGSNIFIRPLTTDDLSIFKAMRTRAVTEYPHYFLDNKQSAENKTKEEWLDFLSRENKEVFGLFDDKTLIGIASILISEDCPNQNRARLAMGFIIPEYRGRGLSNLLYNTRIQWARNHPNINTVFSSHRKGNAPSSKAMTKHGLIYSHDEGRRYGDGSTAQSLIYELDLRKH